MSSTYSPAYYLQHKAELKISQDKWREANPAKYAESHRKSQQKYLKKKKEIIFSEEDLKTISNGN